MMVTWQDWLDIAAKDLRAARHLHTSGDFLQVGFFCQQALEKALKAIFVAQHGRIPPRTHDLAQLSEATGLLAAADGYLVEKLPEMIKISDLCMRSRYVDPRWKEAMAELETAEFSEALLIVSEEVFSWLRAQLLSAE